MKNFLLLVILLSSGVLYPSEKGGWTTPDDLIKIARRENPEIKSALRHYQSAKSAVIPARTPDYPWLGYSIDDEKMKTYSISQMYPFFGKLTLKGKEAKSMSDALYQMYRDKELEVIVRLKTEYYQLFFIEKAIEIYQQGKELLGFYTKVAQSKYTVGQTPISEVLRAQIEQAKYENMLITLEQERETALARINTLLNRPPDEELGKTVEPENFDLKISSFAQLLDIARRKSPKIQSGYSEWQSARESLKLSRMGYLPDFMGTYKWIDRNMDNAGWEAMLGINLPLYFWKQIYSVKEKGYQEEAAKENYQSEINEISYRLKKIWTELNTFRRLINLYKETIIPQAEQGLKSAEIAYQANKLSFLELLDTQRSLLDFRLEYYQYVAEYEKSLAELEMILGEEL